MKKYSSSRKSKLSIIRNIVVSSVIGLVPLFMALQASASPITNRILTMSSSLGNASNVSYALSTAALPTTGAAVKSAEIKFCTSLIGACATPAGFSASASTLAAPAPTGLGGAGWTVNTSTAGSLRILNAANSTNPSGLVTVNWDGVHNPTAVNTTFYGIITTYSDAAWTTPIDTGSVALSTSAQIQVALTVDETLTFCTGTSITGQNCATASGSLVNLGNASTTATSTGTSIIAASTNGNTGYSVSVAGSTLTSGSNTITAMAGGGASAIGTSQFGMNLYDGVNTTPVVGALKTGTGTGSASSSPAYGVVDNFRFATGEKVAEATGPTNANTFTVGYIANINGLTPAGVYTTNLTYTATANF